MNWDFRLAFFTVSILFAVLSVYKTVANVCVLPYCLVFFSDWKFAVSSFTKQGAVTKALVVS